MPGLFSTPSTPAPPPVAVAPPMPDQQSPQVVETANNAAITASQRAGRQSTVVGRQAPGSAADTFSGNTLGNANR